MAHVRLFPLIGAATFTLGNQVLDQQGAGDRMDAEGAQASGSPLAIVFGSVLDGIPESFVLGLTVLQGGVRVALLVGIILSNLPEGLSSSSGLRIAGWSRTRVLRMWGIVVVVAAVSAALGYLLLDPASGHTGAFAQAFAAGALLAMVTPTPCCRRVSTSNSSTEERWWQQGLRSRSRCRRPDTAAPLDHLGGRAGHLRRSRGARNHIV